MQVGNAASLYNSQRRENEISYKKSADKAVLLQMSGEGFTQYVHAVRDGYVSINGVRLSISDEAKIALEKMYSKWQEQQEIINEIWVAESNAKWAKQTGNAYEEAFKDQSIALEIARRISKGGQVPASDERKLIEYDAKLYQMAKQAGLMAKQHKKYKEALFKEEVPENREPGEELGPDHVDLVMEVPVEMVTDGAEIGEITSETDVK